MPCQDEQLLALTEYNISFTHWSTALYKTDTSAQNDLKKVWTLQLYLTDVKWNWSKHAFYIVGCFIRSIIIYILVLCVKANFFFTCYSVSVFNI